MQETGSTLIDLISSTRMILRGSSAVLALAGAALLSSCASEKNVGGDVLKECVLTADQGGTINGRWYETAVPVAFYQGAFTQAEIGEMVTAMKTWNEFFAKSMGYPAIDYGSDASPRTSNDALSTNASDYCANSNISFLVNPSGGNFDFNGSRAAVIYKNSSWPSVYAKDAIAYTTTCREGRAAGHLAPYFTKAYIELNFQYFFTAGNRAPDLQSIVLHELGHLLGLNHSCESAGANGVPRCTARGLPSSYSGAVMYPSFGFASNGSGQQRRVLNENDQGRMNCTYKEL